MAAESSEKQLLEDFQPTLVLRPRNDTPFARSPNRLASELRLTVLQASQGRSARGGLTRERKLLRLDAHSTNVFITGGPVEREVLRNKTNFRSK